MHLSPYQWKVLRENTKSEESLHRVLEVLGTKSPQPFGRGQLVLVVDDDPSIITFVHDTLEKNGFIPMVSTSARASLSILSVQPPDLILIDISMPDMDGNEFFTKLRALPETAETPVVFITGLISPDEEIEFNLKSEANKRYLAKPFTPAKLLTMLVEMLQAPTKV